MSLRKIDLNLLVVFDALIEERSVRKAGLRIGLSQSATSHALGRLRAILEDELLVRTPSGMEPTPRALQLAAPLRLALQEIEATLVPDRFDPATADREFTIAVETYETIGVLAPLVDRVRAEAPGVDIVIRSGSEEAIYDDIDKGRADLAIGAFRALPDRFMTRHLLTDDYVCVMRSDHELAAQPMSMKAFLTTPHLFVSMSGSTFDAVDEALAAKGLQRRIAFRLPHGLAAVIALARSDMIAVVSHRAARLFVQVAPLVIVDPPFTIPSVKFRLIWNRRLHESTAHQWLRSLFTVVGDGGVTSE
jgi:DNA-binding transcriptional LysR family regulator